MFEVEFNVYGTGAMRHTFYGPATRVEEADDREQAVAFATGRYPDRKFELVAVTARA